LSGETFWAALGLMLLLEGLLPLLAPGSWRATFQRLLALRDGQLRFFGLICVVLGAIVLAAVS
jgi:uncharacterized protein YjeT (DUF2065 family)